MGEFGTNLRRFSDMDDVQVAKDDPDVRGWDVVTSDGRDIGEVKDLLVDPGVMKVRALEVELDGSKMNIKDNRRVAIPVDAVQLNDSDNDVVVNGIGLEEIGRLPLYSPGPSSESAFRSPGTRAASTTEPLRPGAENYANRPGAERMRASGYDDERETLTRSEEELAVGKREVEAGEVRVGKHVETEHVTREVQRERDEVHIERRPVTEQTAGSAQLGSDEIRVPITEEELVVEKRPVVKEELIISKERVAEPQKVEADLKKERFDIENQGEAFDENERKRRGEF